MNLLVKKGVFHPGYFFSTRFLLSSLARETLHGLLSFFAISRGARIQATDISAVALESLHLNKEKLGISDEKMTITKSDLFDQISVQAFDYILINPPYYPVNPQNEEEKAWYCGEDFNYFRKLFQSIHPFMQPNTRIWVSLSQDCNLKRIQEIADQNNLKLLLIRSRFYMGEKNMIYSLVAKGVKSN